MQQKSQSTDSQILAEKASQPKFDSLSSTQIWAYGVGHFLNDLTAACWFNYLLFFLKTVVKTSAAATALLAGQLCDGIATPIVGILSDRCSSQYGKRTPWYIGGLIITMLSFLPIFLPFHGTTLEELAYYSIFPGLFNIGWACMQISHMSLVPSLTCSRKRRDTLNNYRNSFTFLANCVVLGLGLAVFTLMKEKQQEFRVIAFCVLVIGFITSIFFLTQVKEAELSKACAQKKEKLKEKLGRIKQKQTEGQFNNQDAIQSDRQLKKNTTVSTVDQNIKSFQDVIVIQQEKKENISLTYWLVKPKFYLFGICYMCVRLNSNIFGTFLPFYLTKVLKISSYDEDSISIPFSLALVPLIIYFSSSLITPKLSVLYSRILGRGKTLILGAILQAASSVCLSLLTQQTQIYIYPLGVVIGIAQAMILATGINLISDVIGSKGDSGAFVFGIYSFLDKISAGIIIFMLANLPCFSNEQVFGQGDELMLKGTVVGIPILTAGIAAIIAGIYNVSEYILGANDKLSESKMENQEFVHSVTLHPQQ